MTNLQVLLLILGFIVLTVGSFIWFIATWDARAEPQLSGRFGPSATSVRGIAT